MYRVSAYVKEKGLRLFRQPDGSGSDWQAGIPESIFLNLLADDYALNTAEKLPTPITTEHLGRTAAPKNSGKGSSLPLRREIRTAAWMP